MKLILERSDKMPFHTDLRVIFDAIGNAQKNYNWLITDLDCNYFPEDLQKEDEEQALWLTGELLTKIVSNNDFQIIWGVFSGFNRDTVIDLENLGVFPYADGNSDLWDPNVKIQHPLARMEIVCWDSTATLFISKDEELISRFQKFFPEAVNLEVCSKRNL